MNDGSHYIDVILFAMVAVFLGLRLRSVLGRRTGNERPPPRTGLGPDRPAPRGPVIDVIPQPVPPQTADRRPASGDDALASALARIRALDPGFSAESFLSGASAAFEMILRAFTQGDGATLRRLLSDEVFENFIHVVNARRDAGEICQNELVKLVSADIVEAQPDGRKAQVTVRFVSQQIIVVKNAAGEVVEGDPAHVATVTDLWTFERDLRSRDPNWLLVGTRSQDE